MSLRKFNIPNPVKRRHPTVEYSLQTICSAVYVTSYQPYSRRIIPQRWH